MTYWIDAAWDALTVSSRWMAWNLFLALVPLVLSVWLFRQAKSRSLFWWLGVLVFVVFLPNAPYVLTDLIHFVDEIQSTNSLLLSTLVIIPKYVLFLLIGVQAYVLAVINVGHYLKQHHLGRFVPYAEWTLHGLSAIGVYLGRFERFNSWDLLTRLPAILQSTIANLLERRSLALIMIGFVCIAGVYWLMKQITLALLLQRQYFHALQQLRQTDA